VEPDDEVEAALAQRVGGVAQVVVGELGDEVGVRSAEVEGDHAGERELLPGAASEGEVVLQGHVALGPDEVMRELAAGAGQLKDLLVRLDDVELRPGHARRQAEQAGLLGDVVGAGGREVRMRGR
jgi:hypothetical protein